MAALIVAMTTNVVATINAALYAVFASAARRLLASGRAQRRFNVLGGSILSAAGLWALFARNPG
jgi:threonine/homoserine/homoserine lactone efflux protein